jgi:Ca2+-binding EF-hand superfamily protein
MLCREKIQGRIPAVLHRRIAQSDSKQGGYIVNKPWSILLVATCFIAGVGYADAPGEFGRGNMHFDAKAMDRNGDGMISKEEMMQYTESMWNKMTRNQNIEIPVADAGRDFARGGLRFNAKAMDANGDGKISKEEFTKYVAAKFDKMKKDPNGMISVADAARDFGRGNMHAGTKAKDPSSDHAATK